jgi:hypothetical protein
MGTLPWVIRAALDCTSPGPAAAMGITLQPVNPTRITTISMRYKIEFIKVSSPANEMFHSQDDSSRNIVPVQQENSSLLIFSYPRLSVLICG